MLGTAIIAILPRIGQEKMGKASAVLMDLSLLSTTVMASRQLTP